MADDRKEEILEQYTKDVRAYMSTLKWIVVALCIVLALFVAGMVVLQVHNQKMMKEIANHSADTIVEFLSEYDWEIEYEIETTGNEYYSGNVFVEK